MFYLPTYLTMYLSTYPPILQSIYLPTYLTIYLSFILQSIYLLSTYPSTYLSYNLSICYLPIHLPTYLTIYLSVIYLSIYLPILQSIYLLSTYPSTYLSCHLPQDTREEPRQVTRVNPLPSLHLRGIHHLQNHSANP